MKRVAFNVLSVLYALDGVEGHGQEASGSPVQKVIELLQENKMKLQADLDAEGKEMEEYSNFCDDEVKEKAYAIKTAERTITGLTAAVQDADAQTSSLGDEVATLGTEMAEKEKQLGSATAERMGAKADFDGTEKELVESIDQLDRAVVTLKRSVGFIQASASAKTKHDSASVRKDVKIALAVISRIVDASWVNEGSRKALKGFLQEQAGADSSENDDLSLHPKVASLLSQSGGIVEQIEDMKEKAEETLSQARQAEMKAHHNYDMMSQSLGDSLKISKEKLANAKHSSSVLGEEKGKASGELVAVGKTKAADEAYAATLKHDCQDAAANWARRQVSAREEMAVIEKAKSILSDRVKVFVQSGSKLAAIKAKIVDVDDTDDSPAAGQRQLLVKKLKVLSQRFGSYAMMEMVSAAAADPFEKIKGLIEQMITKLVEEANQEATQKGFCDEETLKSNTAKDTKSMRLDKLKSRMDKASSSQAELEQSIKDLEKEIAALDKGESQATTIRNNEHTTYEKASVDFKTAAEACNEAMRMLKEYYQGAFVQEGSKSTMSTERQPELGGNQGDAAHVIISILEMSGEDFQKLYLQTEQDEREALDAYAKLQQENKVSRASKTAEAKGAASQIKSIEVALRNGKEDSDMTSKELDAVLEYLDKLRPQCETKVMSFAEKKARREAEIAGLKDAMEILEGPASLMQARVHAPQTQLRKQK